MKKITINKFFAIFYIIVFSTSLIFLYYWEYRFLIKTNNTHIEDKTESFNKLISILVKEDFHRIESVLKTGSYNFLHDLQISDINGIDFLFFVKDKSVIKSKNY